MAPPALPFSFRTVMRREYTGLMVVILFNAGVQFTEHMIIDRRVVYEVFWVTLLIGGTGDILRNEVAQNSHDAPQRPGPLARQFAEAVQGVGAPRLSA